MAGKKAKTIDESGYIPKDLMKYFGTPKKSTAKKPAKTSKKK